jgi:hypothetical protein
MNDKSLEAQGNSLKNGGLPQLFALACDRVERGIMKAEFLTLAATLFLSVMTFPNAGAATFGKDVEFLRGHTGVIVLRDEAGRSKLVVAPLWQGRVMTSTAGGDNGLSFGWINRDLIASRMLQEHINVFGGEDRLWLGPEGGQFSIFFARGAKFDLEHWFTPKPIDTLPWSVVTRSEDSVTLAAQFSLENFSGTHFDLKVEREVRLLASDNAWKNLGMTPKTPTRASALSRPSGGAKAEGEMQLVAYESSNKIVNVGHQAWKKETGLLSIWILGMFNPSPGTTIVVPIKAGPESEFGVPVTSDYFGPIPSTRLKVTADAIYFSADGKFRSKIGINPRRSKAVLGSYDAENKVLTIVQFTQPEGATEYVNSLWKIQDHPYGGDAANSYNDGPPAPGARPMGPFYELESSSPAAALAPGQSLVHVHRTIHLMGPEPALDEVAKKILGVSLADIQSALK